MGRICRWIVFLAVLAAVAPAAAGAQVLRVGTYNGIPGQFSSIQAAVNAARPGDWVLVAPGDYKTTGNGAAPAGQPSFPAGVLMTTPDVFLRGMNRNTVIVDGTKPGSAPCSPRAADQNFGAAGPGGTTGLNGIMVWKADDVWVQNLTACNFLGGTADAGNEIWWNGGADSGRIGGHGYLGSYLTATSTFFSDETTAAQYGIFSSNWSGGTWDQIYASNFNDSGFYIGACQQVCDQTLNHGWAENNALGYSGTNSGGRLLIENSQFDDNEDGFDTNSQNADEPAPQDGACPAGESPPVKGAPSCWVFYRNYVHDNNNPNVPTAGSAAAGPVGTGMSVSGARDDTIMDNTFANNGAWGTIFVPYPDSGPPCTGGTLTPAMCLFDEWGDALIGNTYSHNGFFGNPTNGDFGAANTEPGPTDCYSGNVEPGGAPATSSPPTLQTTYPTCNGQTVPPNSNGPFLSEVACDSESIQLATVAGGTACLPTDSYPRQTQVKMAPLPAGLPTMPDPCAGVPVNPWCSGQTIGGSGGGGSGGGMYGGGSGGTRGSGGGGGGGGGSGSGSGGSGAGGRMACSARHVTLRLRLAVRERFVSVSVRVGARRAVVHRARGRRATVRFTLGRRVDHRLKVRVVERIRVRRHRETIRFTRIYNDCG